MDAQNRLKIISNSQNKIFFKQKKEIRIVESDDIIIQVRLQRPFVDIDKCIGCGICEHECPISGQRAIRISAEGQSREYKSSLLLKPT